MQKRKIMDSLEMKRFSLPVEPSMKKRLTTEPSMKKRLTPAQLLTFKKTKLLKKSRIDIMMRRKKRETIKEVRKYKEEEMKRIDAEVASMKRDLLSYMLKELEEQKKLLQVTMETAIEEEKQRRLKLIELELSQKSVDEKYVQTNSYPESVDQKYEEILRELKEIKHSSVLCKSLLTKSNIGHGSPSTTLTQESSNSSSFADDVSKGLITVSSIPPIQPCDFNSRSHSSSPNSVGNNSRNFLPKMSQKAQSLPQHHVRRNSLVTIPDNSATYPSYLSTKDNIPGSNKVVANDDANVRDNTSMISLVTNLANREPSKKLAIGHFSRDGNAYNSKTLPSSSERYSTQQKMLNQASQSFHNTETSFGGNPSHEDIVILDENNFSSGHLDTSNDNRTSFHENNAAVYRETIEVKEEPSDSEHSLYTRDNITDQNPTQQDTATYIRNLLSSEQNKSLCNESPSISEENTAAYIKKLLISSQVKPSDITISSYNNTQNISVPYDEATYHGKPEQMSSTDTALYIKNLLLTSHGNTNPQSSSTQVGNNTASSFNQVSFSVNNASNNSRGSDVKQNFAFGAKKKVYPHTDSSAYNIYTYNKKLISTQEKRGVQYRSANDIKSYSVRKKRELNKRIYEKYGPLKNHLEISDMIQSDAIFLSLPAMERYGILSCLTRSVAEHLTLSKDLLEELFSREVLSISSCKGSPIKTPLNPDKLALIRKIVFSALPSHDEKALWEMIQDSIDTKCRGILRNMKKKLSKQSFFEC